MREALMDPEHRSNECADGLACEALMGPWSRAAAERLLGWLGLPAGLRWLDVGCGTGALSESTLRHARPGQVLGVDRYPGYVAHAVAHAAAHVADERGEREVRTAHRGTVLRIVRGIAILATLATAGAALTGRARAQDVRGTLEVVELESEVFGNRRSLRIWLPPGYDDPANRDLRYPVLYLNDGQNLFDPGTAAGGEEWRVDEAADSLIRSAGVPPFVVVGIDNAGRRARAREYLPWPDAFLEPPEPEPRGDLYDDFLADEVLPLVEGRFRVRRDAAGRALGGSSYGALIALHVAIVRPGLFARLLLESPSFYVDDGHVLRDAAGAPPALDRVYLGVGTNELGLPGCPDHPGNAEAVDGVRRLSALLSERTFGDGGRLLVTIEPCAEHTERGWARRIPSALRFLLGADPGDDS